RYLAKTLLGGGILTFVLLWAIYEVQTRPPLVFHTETRYPVGLRSLDLDLGRIDLDETPQELSQLFQATSGMETVKLEGEYYHKSLWASGVFVALERLASGHYCIHMHQPGIFILTPLAPWLFLFTERHNLPLGPLVP